MTDSYETYRAVHRQGFIPIFVEDGRDARMQVAACVEAGLEVIEYTLRRADVREMIPWVRENYPNLKILVGSTIDNDAIVNKLKAKYPQLMTLDELADLGADGFVSMLRWSEENIRRFSSTHVVVPCATTPGEAYEMCSHGAHLIKFVQPKESLMRKVRAAPTFQFCPVFVTGGMDLQRIPPIIEAGAVSVGTGFDLTLRDRPRDIGVSDIAAVMVQYRETVAQARRDAYPEMMENRDAGRAEWLGSLPHVHPF